MPSAMFAPARGSEDLVVSSELQEADTAGGSLKSLIGKSSPNSAVSIAGSATVASFPVTPQVRDYAAVKEAGRAAALMTSPEEEAALNEERKALVRKRFGGGLSRPEEGRLKYIRWHLHRIDDARNGPAMDRLLTAVQKADEFSRGVRDLLKELDQLSREPRHPFQAR
jgi:hypothetical protein